MTALRPAPALQSGTEAHAALELSGIDAGYERVTILRDVNLVVPKGSLVGLLGPNGAGKTTLLRTASGLLRPFSGTVRINGADLTNAAPNRRAKAGLCLIPEGRGVFRGLTVRDNLRMLAPPWARDESLESAIEVFPVFRGRFSQVAGTLSGGEQQMLALARAYLSDPSVVLLDEVSMGLAPKMVDAIFETLQRLASRGVALLLVEQYVNRVLDMVDTVALLNKGKIVFTGPPKSLEQDQVLRGYLGVEMA